MIFRNEFRELATSLHLTQELEHALDKDGAEGVSLSDKIKSYDTFDMEPMPENLKSLGHKFYYSGGRYHIKDQYEYDDDIDDQLSKYSFYKLQAKKYYEYKRKILNGYYHDLRWAAHERNQLMHQSNYLVPRFTKFKNTLRQALKYFKQDKKSSKINISDGKTLNIFSFILALGFIINIINVPLKMFLNILPDRIHDGITGGVTIFIIILIIQNLNYIKSIIIYLHLLITKNKSLLFLILLSFYLWDKDLNYIITLLEYMEKL